MSTSTRPSSDITRAAERYLEQYGDPLVTNTYLKVTILVLAVVCTALAVLLFRGQMALANVHPLIVRINDVGRAEAIDYRNFQYRPQEAENKYYLTRWAELYFSRNRFIIERDQTNSLYFLNGDVQRAVIDQERKDNIIASYAKDSSLPFVVNSGERVDRLFEGQARVEVRERESSAGRQIMYDLKHRSSFGSCRACRGILKVLVGAERCCGS
jgi:type IV secretory pathway TrbF-like protein